MKKATIISACANESLALVEKLLKRQGFLTVSHATTSKEQQKAVLSCSSDSDVFVFVGGLEVSGLTKSVVAELLQVDLAVSEQSRQSVESYFASNKIEKGKDFLMEGLLTYPEGFLCFPPSFCENMAAYGSISGKEYVLFPDCCEEVQHSFDTYVKNLLCNAFGISGKTIVIKTFGVSEVDIKMKLASLGQDFLIEVDNTLEGRICFNFSSRVSQTTIDSTLDYVLRVLSEHIFCVDDLSLAQVAVNLLSIGRKTLSIAESLTGGMIASAIVDIAGSSEVLNECCVTYSNFSKQSRLLVKSATLQTVGAVSSETAYEMAVGLLNTSKSDIVLATTGIAGPTGQTAQKAKGLTFIAVGDMSKIHIHKMTFLGGRNHVREQASKMALFLLIKLLKRR